MATGGTAGGWRLSALPFMGAVSQRSIVSASELSDTASGRVSIFNRMWKLDNNQFVEFNSDPANSPYVKLYSTKGYGDGLLVYLYPGEKLIAPFSDDNTYLPVAGLYKTGSSPEWKSAISITSYDRKGNTGASNSFYQFGVSSSSSMSLPVLSAPGQTFEAGFKTADGLAAISRKKAGVAGWIWNYSVTSTDDANSVMKLTFSGIKDIPDELEVVIDNPAGGFSTDLRKSGGEFTFECNTGVLREFRIIAGDSTFVNANAIKNRAPAVFSLAQNMPNPFNPVTYMSFQIPDFTSGSALAASRAKLVVYDVRGREIKRIYDRTAQAGYYKVVWDGKNEFNSPVASGVYFYKLTVLDSRGVIRFQNSRKMVMLR
ncbi:MAG: hypothetical protein JNL74_14750 [Fibrobacteres bacterium]|nr:hypothetical protein [Fibrobacterota bacterium]